MTPPLLTADQAPALDEVLHDAEREALGKMRQTIHDTLAEKGDTAGALLGSFLIDMISTIAVCVVGQEIRKALLGPVVSAMTRKSGI